MKIIITEDTYTHPARQLFNLAKISNLVDVCLDGISTLQQALKILRKETRTTAKNKAPLLIEKDGDFIYQAKEGVIFGLMKFNTYGAGPVKGSVYGGYLTALGFPHDDSLLTKFKKELEAQLDGTEVMIEDINSQHPKNNSDIFAAWSRMQQRRDEAFAAYKHPEVIRYPNGKTYGYKK